MAMNKILYVVPALALLGMFSVADADTIQQRIDKLQERIADLQDRIEQSTDQKKIAKWEAKIDRLQERIAELEARQAKAAQSATPPQEPASARQEGDNTPPSLASATFYTDTKTLTVEFDEPVRLSYQSTRTILFTLSNEVLIRGGSDDVSVNSNVVMWDPKSSSPPLIWHDIPPR